MIDLARLGGPFDLVLDIGGNIGSFAQGAHRAWPQATVISFEPIPHVAAESRERAGGSWRVVELAISDRAGPALLHGCLNQPSASTMQEPGPVRAALGIRDEYAELPVLAETLDGWWELQQRGLGVAALYRLEPERLLVKIDVEGHEGAVLAGAGRMLRRAETVVVEVQNRPDVFIDAPSPQAVDGRLREAGLFFAGLAGAYLAPNGQVLQYDGVWQRN